MSIPITLSPIALAYWIPCISILAYLYLDLTFQNTDQMTKSSTPNDGYPLTRLKLTVFNSMECCYSSAEQRSRCLDIQPWRKYHSCSSINNDILLKVSIYSKALHFAS